MSLTPRALTYGMVTASDEEAQAALDESTASTEEEGRQIRARQIAARNADGSQERDDFQRDWTREEIDNFRLYWDSLLSRDSQDVGRAAPPARKADAAPATGMGGTYSDSRSLARQGCEPQSPAARDEGDNSSTSDVTQKARENLHAGGGSEEMADSRERPASLPAPTTGVAPGIGAASDVTTGGFDLAPAVRGASLDGAFARESGPATPRDVLSSDVMRSQPQARDASSGGDGVERHASSQPHARWGGWCSVCGCVCRERQERQGGAEAAREPHKLEVVGASPAPATPQRHDSQKQDGLAKTGAAAVSTDCGTINGECIACGTTTCWCQRCGAPCSVPCDCDEVRFGAGGEDLP